MAKENTESGFGSIGNVDELRYLQQIYQNQYAVATNSMNMVLQELQELNSAHKTIDESDLLKKGDTLSNVGADVFLVSKVQKPDMTIMPVGGGYFIEKDMESSKARLDMLIQRRTENLNRIMKGRKELENALIELSYRIDSMR